MFQPFEDEKLDETDASAGVAQPVEVEASESPTAENDISAQTVSKSSHDGIPHLPFRQLFAMFIGFGLRAWGGPVAHIAMLKEELVMKQRWITVERFNRVLAVYQILPGPEATELCCYFGLLSRGRWGAVVAGLGFVLPGFLMILFLSYLYVHIGLSNANFVASFKAIQPAVAAMVVNAVHRIGKHAVYHSTTKEFDHWLMAIVCLSAIQSTLRINFMITLVFSGVLFVLTQGTARGSWLAPVLWCVIGCALYLIIVFAVGFPSVNATGFGVVREVNPGSLFALGLIAGSITFGGAYTCIPFVQTEVTIVAQWMTKDQFLDGLALSSVIPAPLVIFITFVGFFGGHTMGDSSFGYELLGGTMTTLGMFAPAFSFTIVGHDYFERAIANPSISLFLDGVTASVVGLIVTTALELIKSSIQKEPMCVVIFFGALYLLVTQKHPLMSTAVVLSAALAGQFFFLEDYAVR